MGGRTMKNVTPPEDASGFGDAVATILDATLGNQLLGVYFLGSIALGGYVRGESDIDLAAVCRDRVDEATKKVVAERLLAATIDCPARGLEFTLYRAEVAAGPPLTLSSKSAPLGGPRMPREVRLSSHDEPSFWYVIDRAIAHRHGIEITGLPSGEAFSDAPRKLLLHAMGDSMRWHREHEKTTLYSVLNASRAWRFAVEDVLGSKLEGAGWARLRWRSPAVIDAAVQLRHGRPARLECEAVDRFIAHVETVVAAAASETPG
jgi:hypothetical protein